MRRFMWPLASGLTIIILFLHLKQGAAPQIANAFDKSMYSWLQTFAEVLNLVRSKYYQDVEPEKAMNNAINAFIRTLDPHSAFMDQKEYKSIMETIKGKFGGVGIVMDNTKERDDEFLRVVDTVPSGPADRAGIKPDDKIVQINDEILKGMTIDEIAAKMRGPAGTKVHLKVLRSDTARLLSFDIVREEIKDQNTLCYYFKNNQIYYLALSVFSEPAVKDIEQLITKCQHDGCKGLILDLRNNSGGLLDSVVDIAGLFVPKGSLVVEARDREHNIINEYHTLREPIAHTTIPIFILVNNYTASAAEILAGLLQIYAKKNPTLMIYVVGSQTYGKGSVQELIPLPDDRALKLTIALYNLPGEISIQGHGVVPDFPIEPKFPPSEEIQWINRFFGRENSLKNSIQAVAKEKNHHAKKNDEPKKNDKSWYERKKEIISKDYLILSTVRLVELLSILQKTFPEKANNRDEMLNLMISLYNPQENAALEEVKMK